MQNSKNHKTLTFFRPGMHNWCTEFVSWYPCVIGNKRLHFCGSVQCQSNLIFHELIHFHLDTGWIFFQKSYDKMTFTWMIYANWEEVISKLSSRTAPYTMIYVLGVHWCTRERTGHISHLPLLIMFDDIHHLTWWKQLKQIKLDETHHWTTFLYK